MTTPYRRALEAAAGIADEFGKRKLFEYAASINSVTRATARDIAAAIRALPDEPDPPPGDIEAVADILLDEIARAINGITGQVRILAVRSILITALRDERERQADEVARLKAALEAAPRPEPSKYDPVVYMDWFFMTRIAALAEGGKP
jgi:hypothetical protein